jgi:4-hydroxyphenylacetate 3-monooxygenase
MLRTGRQYLEQLSARGGEIYVGGERVKDPATHPAFRNAARTVAQMYDTTSDRANLGSLTYVEPETGERCNAIFLRPRTRADLEARNRVHEAWARVSR